MNFTKGASIYEQIVEHILEQVVSGSWSAEDRISSVREMAVKLGVNPNTVQRAYAMLQEMEILENRRGVGYFIHAGAEGAAKQRLREEFTREALPWISSRLKLLEIEPEEFTGMLRRELTDGAS
ncbi:GntR family transcriptional regulator [Salinispira pacifica]|uniref:Transcriptional regulator, GntR family n=1 Tax=Salinispira pacifica TaxID=1307761 RepID=V5WL46_9SPIO|nr:GntR family transcriptional regulator [Salinispira pacifica]AHC15916.1 Transcriptional regulator, GntR family [Salinispira pacifica]